MTKAQESGDAPPTLLVAKLVRVMAAVERIPKRGHNIAQNYAYAMEADAADVLRKALVAENVLMTMGVVGHEVVPSPSGKQLVTTLTMTVTFHDGNTGEQLTFPWIGCGADSGDKGVYKALTGAEKYALLKTFLIPTGDDPEADKGTETADVEPAAPRYDASDTQERTMAGAKAVYVTKVRDATSKPGSVKPWKAVFCTLSDGREAGIFTDHQSADTVIPMLRESLRTQRGIFLDLQPGRDGKTFSISSAVWSDEVPL